METQQSKLKTEPPYALKDLKHGRFGFGEFSGQHAIYVPLKIYEALGKERILQIAHEAFGTEAIEKFGVSYILCQNSFLIELPPSHKCTRRFVANLRNAEREARKSAADQ